VPVPTSSWGAATFAGVQDAQREDVAALSPLRRLEWLEDALRLAAHTGALAAARRRKQEEQAAWC
jgi:hypothetical protein